MRTGIQSGIIAKAKKNLGILTKKSVRSQSSLPYKKMKTSKKIKKTIKFMNSIDEPIVITNKNCPNNFLMTLREVNEQQEESHKYTLIITTTQIYIKRGNR